MILVMGLIERCLTSLMGTSNGDPFKNRWRARNREVVDGVLRLKLTKEKFRDGGSATGGGKEYPYISAEVRMRSERYYGVGCYSVCMKPSRESGVSSSLYSHSGNFDIPPGVYPKYHRKHQEIDIEFVGKNTRMMQTNYFDRFKHEHSSSGTGVEKKHELPFSMLC